MENTNKRIEKKTETFMFPIDSKSMIEGETNKFIKIFLNQLDLEFKSLSISSDYREAERAKERLRQVFLDGINGFARFSKGLLKNYASNAQEIERLINAVKRQEN